MGPKALYVLLLLLTIPLASPVRAEDADSPIMKAVAMDAGTKVTPSERKLFEQSIESTKESIARETLDVFYRDALESYHQSHYDEALDQLNKIYSIDPYYEDVATLRETIGRLKNNHDFQSKRGILDDYMRKGNAAKQAGKNVEAVGYWKQALTVNPSYEPAKKKIYQVNHALAQKQYEAGYLYYHHGDMDQALDSWSNAIALDPSFKHRGLLLLMSKVQLAQRREQSQKLIVQASQQYTQKDLPGALQTYEELLKLDSRNEDARRMSAKIKFQLGQAAYKSARDSLSQHLYAQAIKQWKVSIRYGYEVQRSQKGIEEAENLAENAQGSKSANRTAKAKADDTPPPPAVTASVPAPAPPPAEPTNPEEAMAHYREGLFAIRSKDYHRALEELDIAAKLNPADERIYVARERAKQEWNAASEGRPQ